MDLFGFTIPIWAGQVLALLGALDIILGIVSKWTPWKWDDNLYSIIHNIVSKLVKR